jgi:hypothetical protein
MSCCPGSSVSTVVLTNRDQVRVRYKGDNIITVIGPSTGLRYTFSAQHQTAVIDPRDALALLKSRHFRLEGVVNVSPDDLSSGKSA